MTQGSQEQSKIDAIIDFVARKGEVSPETANRLVQQIFRKKEPIDHYLQTEVGEIALGLILTLSPEEDEWRMKGEKYGFATLSGNSDTRTRWLVTIPKELAPEIIIVWDRYVRATFSALGKRALLKSTNPQMGKDLAAIRTQLQKAEQEVEMARKAWDKARKENLPVMLAVDNDTGHEDALEGVAPGEGVAPR